MFTQQHYIEIAKTLKRNKQTIVYGKMIVFKKLVLDFVEMFRKNPKFNEKKFLDAIYGKEEKV